jgi:hypothetical protein
MLCVNLLKWTVIGWIADSPLRVLTEILENVTVHFVVDSCHLTSPIPIAHAPHTTNASQLIFFVGKIHWKMKVMGKIPNFFFSPIKNGMNFVESISVSVIVCSFHAGRNETVS